MNLTNRKQDQQDEDASLTLSSRSSNSLLTHKDQNLLQFYPPQARPTSLSSRTRPVEPPSQSSLLQSQSPLAGQDQNQDRNQDSNPSGSPIFSLDSWDSNRKAIASTLFSGGSVSPPPLQDHNRRVVFPSPSSANLMSSSCSQDQTVRDMSPLRSATSMTSSSLASLSLVIQDQKRKVIAPPVGSANPSSSSAPQEHNRRAAVQDPPPANLTSSLSSQDQNRRIVVLNPPSANLSSSLASQDHGRGFVIDNRRLVVPTLSSPNLTFSLGSQDQRHRVISSVSSSANPPFSLVHQDQSRRVVVLNPLSANPSSSLASQDHNRGVVIPTPSSPNLTLASQGRNRRVVVPIPSSPNLTSSLGPQDQSRRVISSVPSSANPPFSLANQDQSRKTIAVPVLSANPPLLLATNGENRKAVVPGPPSTNLTSSHCSQDQNYRNVSPLRSATGMTSSSLASLSLVIQNRSHRAITPPVHSINMSSLAIQDQNQHSFPSDPTSSLTSRDRSHRSVVPSVLSADPVTSLNQQDQRSRDIVAPSNSTIPISYLDQQEQHDVELSESLEMDRNEDSSKNSNHGIIYEGYQYYFRRDLVKSKEYRCKYRDTQDCKASLKKMKSKKNNQDQVQDQDQDQEQEQSEVDIQLKGTHVCDPNRKSPTKTNLATKCRNEDIKTVDTDYDQVRNMMENEPLKGRMYFHEECIKRRIKISKNKVKELLRETREEKFPTNISVILSDVYCKTQDESCSQLFLQYQGETSVPAQNSKDTMSKKSFLIFASIFMLKQLEESAWFIDATFSIVPSGFYQLLTILVYNSSARTYVPAVYILMGCKHQTMYEMAFTTLKGLCKNNNINADPTHIMSDFEMGLRNALRSVYLRAEVMGCYFHYCQALWNYAHKHGLKTLNRITTTKRLITLLKLLPHIEIEERKAWFNQIQAVFKNREKPYKEFLTYYLKYWLNSFSINFDDIEGNNRLVRTNNICEQYNRRLNQKLQIKHPRLSILVSSLLEEEALFKQKIIGSLSQITIDLFLNHCSVTKDDALPFSTFNTVIHELKTSGYNLRSITKNKALLDTLESLSQKCHDFIFTKFRSQTEIDNEVASKNSIAVPTTEENDEDKGEEFEKLYMHDEAKDEEADITIASLPLDDFFREFDGYERQSTDFEGNQLFQGTTSSSSILKRKWPYINYQLQDEGQVAGGKAFKLSNSQQIKFRRSF